MAPTIRPATTDDIAALVDLLLQDAEARRAVDPILWKIDDDAPTQIEKALTFALTAEQQPFRQIWQVAEEAGALTGVIHSMLLPVPPIYAGPLGDPGLILPDSFAAPGASNGTVDALVAAAEKALQDSGARILLSSYVTGQDWQDSFARRNYAPLTLYLSRSDLGDTAPPATVRPATEADVPGIVARSALHRKNLIQIDPFWETHPEADARFGAWMTRSLSLLDRDMRVIGPADDLDGYVIAQPASRLHFPPAHDITGTGVIDDFHHRDLTDIATLDGGEGAAALIHAAEAALARRGMGADFVVCPAGWPSKIALLEGLGYETAMVWSIKRG
ncbi:hypothetical protein [Marinibacterium profundimaris]|uniref:Uncharacterized protein n=1 Tax=Marinibacterium profundimaris TaxID=1679460 RepID=A0A225ND18_9RHOB|nr:hypothetical protein [Marinibacterium profundimaris]OWU69000.1 hypothetical protein ATO3_23085 [Marinibacterium profundimaris]